MSERPYVGRGGLKLEHALREFRIDVTGLVAADFGCNVGGFTDCLLRHGARRVYAVDTGYGMLDYHLRRDERVVVMERTNALHAPPPDEPIDLVVIDAGWTPQRLIVPAAQRWLRGRDTTGGEPGRIITLIKPHYERSAGGDGAHAGRSDRGVVPDDEARRIAHETAGSLAPLGIEVAGLVESPLRGGASKGRRGNIEFLALLRSGASGLV